MHNLQLVLSLVKDMTIKIAETYCEAALAIATPATSRCHTITKKRFNNTLIIPAINKYTIGFLVLPLALKIALP